MCRVTAQPRDGGRAYAEDTILVKWADADLADAARAETPLLLRAVDAEVEWTSRLVPGLAVVRVHSRQVESALLLAMALEGVEYAELDRFGTPTDEGQLCPPVTPFDPDWALTGNASPPTPNANWAHELVRARWAWRGQTNGTGPITAVLDSGVKYTIADVSPNMYVNPGEIAGNSIDDDSNGYVDDVYGANMVEGAGQPPAGDPVDLFYHGTCVASIIGAQGNNSLKMTGLCWQARLIAVRVFSAFDNAESNCIKGIEYAYDRGSRLMNCSWQFSTDFGGAEPLALKQLMSSTPMQEVLFVVAAANYAQDLDNDSDTYASWPAQWSFSNFIVVGACDVGDIPWSDPPIGSNYGATRVDLFAPGNYLLALRETGAYYNWPVTGFNATSGAAPFVTATAALVWTKHLTWKVVDVKNQILSTVDVPSNGAYTGLCVTNGRLNMQRALEEDCE